ncbi:MAG: hypothetical protein ACQEWG_07240 [Bacteroidota bacterium]
MNPIGGYFELELRKGDEYHKGAIRLNTGRNALELILKTRQYSKIYIPYFTCDVILEPFNKLAVEYEFYSIDENLEPIFDFEKMQSNEGFLYTNYFGIKDFFINSLSDKCKNLIIDNSQSFFSKPLSTIPTFYSCRKFFGVPDGAYLYLDGKTVNDLPFDNSENRVTHLLKRIDYGAEHGYKDYKANEKSLIGQPIKRMSKLTQSILSNIDYDFVRKKRRDNFQMFHEKLGLLNKFELKLHDESVPMVYPFRTEMPELKRKLNEQKIFSPTFWTNVLEWANIDSLDYKFVQEIIHLPIDQRITLDENNIIIKHLKNFNK